MKLKFLITGFALLTMVMVAPMVNAEDPFTWEGTIAPQDVEGFPLIPISDTESMDVTVDSDIPLTIFIIDSQEYYEDIIALSEGDIENFTGYVQKYEGETHKKLTQDHDPEKSYWVMMYNPSETETAEVTVEYEFWEDIASEIVEDAVSDACCGLTMGAGVIGTLVLIAIVLIAKRRK